MIPLCRYILQGGNQCQQAAITGENYCRHHLVVRRTVAASTPKPNPYRIEKPLALVFPEDRAALMIDVFVVMQAFNEGQISPKSANILTRLLHEAGVILKQGPLYDSDREHAVRRVVVTPEGEEIAPAREVPEAEAASGEAVRGEAVSDEAVSDEAVSAFPTSQNRDVGHPQSDPQSDQESHPSPTSQKRDVGHPQANVSVSQMNSDSFYVPPASAGDFACNDPCYIETLTQRREQYRKLATYELAAGLDPRPWEKFIPGKSKVKRPKTMLG